MSIFRRNAAPPPPDPPAPTPLEHVAAVTAKYEQTRAQRDRAIANARRQGEPLREIAAASNLSVSRVKQIEPGRVSGRGTTRPPIAEIDLTGELGEGQDPAGERVMALLEADPFLPMWPSERAFIEADPRRESFMDVLRNVHDLGDNEVWQVCYIPETQEIYAWTSREADPTYDGTEKIGASAHGPCYLLGHVISWDLVRAGIVVPGWKLIHRPGGLAWLLGRVQLLNRATAALGTDYRLTLDAIRDYLENLPQHERPS